jgi:hypothetical protein
MNWTDFKEFTVKTAVYRGAERFDVDEAAYLGLALTGEVGELLEEVRKGDATRETVLLELGDIFYYLARADRFFQHFGWFSFEDQPPNSVVYDKDMLAKCTAICNLTKKLMREDPDTLVIIQKLRPLYAETYGIACASAIWRKSSREEVCQMVADKLLDRLERGVIRGSGDSR